MAGSWLWLADSVAGGRLWLGAAGAGGRLWLWLGRSGADAVRMVRAGIVRLFGGVLSCMLS